MKTQKKLRKLTVTQLLSKLEKQAFYNGQRNAAWFKHAINHLQDKLRKGNSTFAHQFGSRIQKLSHNG